MCVDYLSLAHKSQEVQFDSPTLQVFKVVPGVLRHGCHVVCSSLSTYLFRMFSINVQETSGDTFIFYLSSRGLLLLALSKHVTNVMIDFHEHCSES